MLATDCSRISAQFTTDFSRYGNPSMVVQRHALKAALLDGLTVVEHGKTVTSVDMHSGVVQCSDGERVQSDVVIGADGVNGVCRQTVVGDGKSYRGVMRLGTEVALAELTPDTLAFMERNPLFMMLNTNGTVAFVTHNKPNASVVASLAWAEADERNTEDARVQYLDEYPTPVRELLSHAASGQYARGTAKPYYDRDPLTSFAYERVLLLGDAAHPMTPYQGQGANLALEDAVTLAHLLQQHKGDLAGLGAAFDSARVQRCNELQKASRSGMYMFHVRWRLLGWLRNRLLGSVSADRMVERNDKVYGWKSPTK